MALAKEAGAARVIQLQVSAPFHCSLMEDLKEEFAAELDRYEFREPRVPVVANVTGDYVRTAEEIKEALRRQVAGAVRWADSMRRLAEAGCDTFIEAGPGRALTGMSLKSNPGLAAYGVEDGRRLDAALAKLQA